MHIFSVNCNFYFSLLESQRGVFTKPYLQYHVPARFVWRLGEGPPAGKVFPPAAGVRGPRGGRRAAGTVHGKLLPGQAPRCFSRWGPVHGPCRRLSRVAGWSPPVGRESWRSGHSSSHEAIHGRTDALSAGPSGPDSVLRFPWGQCCEGLPPRPCRLAPRV